MDKWTPKNFNKLFPNAKTGDAISIRWKCFFGLIECEVVEAAFLVYNNSGIFIACGSEIRFIPWKKIVGMYVWVWGEFPEAAGG